VILVKTVPNVNVLHLHETNMKRIQLCMSDDEMLHRGIKVSCATPHIIIDTYTFS
jgi:hypothetical protein